MKESNYNSFKLFLSLSCIKIGWKTVFLEESLGLINGCVVTLRGETFDSNCNSWTGINLFSLDTLFLLNKGSIELESWFGTLNVSALGET